MWRSARLALLVWLAIGTPSVEGVVVLSRSKLKGRVEVGICVLRVSMLLLDIYTV